MQFFSSQVSLNDVLGCACDEQQRDCTAFLLRIESAARFDPQENERSEHRLLLFSPQSIAEMVRTPSSALAQQAIDKVWHASLQRFCATLYVQMQSIPVR